VTLESRRLFAETMHSPEPDLGLACLLIAAEADPAVDLEAGLSELDRLARSAEASVPIRASAREVALGLRSALGDEAGFRGYGDDYADLRSSLLPDVLRRRRGLPILLSVVYLEVARRVGVPLEGVGAPGHFVVRVPGEPAQLLDPFFGGRLVSDAELLERYDDGGGGRLAEAPSAWPASTPVATVLRILQNIRALGSSVRVDGLAPALRSRALLTARNEGPAFALWATDLALLLPHHPVTLRRERATLRARRGDFGGAADDLEEFADLVDGADEAAAKAARRDANLLRARLN
jgi:regulator of sirC expression with transglutaminase-like and TPR domain